MKQRSPESTFRWQDPAAFLIIFSAATGLSFLLRPLDGGEASVPMLFHLAVFLVSRFTGGYFYGILASLAGVVLVNYIFTYPYFAVNFLIPGYPVTFLSMLVISLMTSTMTTQIKKQERLRRETEQEKMRANLLRAVSHDLRTPLTSIVGVTSALLEDEGSLSEPQRRGLLQEAHDDAEWLIRMVENLLSVTRISGKTANLQKSEEMAEEIAASAMELFRKRHPSVQVDVRIPEDPIFVPMDPILIQQVITNLLENAVQHGKRNDGIVFAVSRDGQDAVFSVRDHGAGIPPADFPHLFDGLLSTGTSADATRNMGIGLSVCRSIVHAHGGKMTAENCTDGGACFCFTLPMEDISHGS